jgi:hypothetical protein
MGQGRALANADDGRKARRLTAAVPHEHFHAIRQLALRVAGPQHGPEGSEGALGDVDGLANLADLPIVLDHAQLLDAIGTALPGDRRCGRLQGFEISDGESAALETDAAKAELVQHLGDGIVELLGWRTDVRREITALFANLLREARIADEDGPLAPLDENAAIAAEAGEVGDVDRIGNGEGVESFVGEERHESSAARRGRVHGRIVERRRRSGKRDADFVYNPDIAEREGMTMQIPVLVEPIANNGYRARSGEPLVLEAQGATEEEAIANFKAMLAAKIAAGTKVVAVDVPGTTENPWLKGAGMFKDDPMFDLWQESIAERRRAEDAESELP